MKSARPRIDVNLDELDRVLDGARQAPLSEDDYEKLKEALHALAAMLVRPRNTEKTNAVLGKSEGSEPSAGTQPETDASSPPGHGRNGAGAFVSSRKIEIAHSQLKHGDRCPECGKGNVYGQKDPKVLVRIVGQAPAGRHCLLARTAALRCMQTGIYRTRTGRSRSGKIRRDRGSDDRATQVRQWDPVLPVGTTPRSDGDSVTGGDAMGGCRRGGRVT
jgi:hypothetical protein